MLGESPNRKEKMTDCLQPCSRWPLYTSYNLAHFNQLNPIRVTVTSP